MRRLLAGGAVAAAALVVVSPASATRLDVRTARISAVAGGAADGPSTSPVVSANGRMVAYVSAASNLGVLDPNGPATDVLSFDLTTGQLRLVSAPALGVGADGPSNAPAISADGSAIAFTSAATNLAPGDANGAPDVFVSYGAAGPVRVSVAADGGDANGASSDPDISANGRFVTFTSTATNLVATPVAQTPQVYVRDLATQTTRLVSAAADGSAAAGASGSASMSPDGRYVSFSSTATNLVAGDTNGVADVFLRDLDTGKTERVSVASDGTQQNRSVAAPFPQLSDVSSGGRFVAFDTDATNLYDQDTNQRTDVYVRDRRRGRTTLLSASSLDVQGDNDSYAPRISADGAYVAFSSLASNLALPQSPGEDLFVRDQRSGTTSQITVPASNGRHLAEQTTAGLRRVSISDDALVGVFAASDPAFAPGGAAPGTDVYVRRLDPPAVKTVTVPELDTAGTLVVTTDDPAATTHTCRFDAKRPFVCGSRIRVRPGDGRLLAIRGGGPGMLSSPALLRVRLSYDRSAPDVSIGRPRSAQVRGTASDRSGVASVEVGVVVAGVGGCRYLTAPGRLSARSKAACAKTVLVRARGARAWSVRLPGRIRGPYAIYVRATDRLGNVSRLVIRRGRA